MPQSSKAAFGSVLMVFIAMLSVQSGASLAKQLFPIIGPQPMTILRLTFATLILWCLARPWRGGLTRPMLKAVVLYGFSLGAMNYFFYLSLERIPLGVSIALEFVGPLTL